MLARWFPGLAVLCVLGAAPPVLSAETAKAEPTLVVRVRSLNDLIAGARYLVSQAGAEEQARQFEGMVKARIGRKGLEGIDPKRPFGLYAADLNDNPFVVMMPLADEKAFVRLLKNLKLEVEKDKEGVYTVTVEFLPVEFYFRVANGYAYVTALSATLLATDKLLDPSILKPLGQTELVSASLYLARLPAVARQLVLAGVEKQVNKLRKQKPPRETETQEEFRVQFLNDLAGKIVAIIKQGDELNLRFDLDRKAGKVAAQVSLTARNGSNLARNILDLGQATSLFGGLRGNKPALRSLVHFTLPQNVRKALAPVIDETLKQLQRKETDETRRELSSRLLKALTPSLKAGEFDAVLSLDGSGKAGKYTGLVGVKLRDGAEVDKAVRDLIDKISPHTEKVKFKDLADKVDGVTIHQITFQEDLNKQARKMFGDNPLYVAFRKDALLVTWGDKGLDLMKTAISVQPKTSPIFQYEVSLAQLAPVFTLYRRNDKVTERVKEVFGESKDPGTIRFTLAGGKALTARFSFTGAVLKFIALTARDEARKRSGEAEKEDQ